MDDDASYIWKDQVQVHKRQPGLEGTKVTEEEFIMSPEPAHLLGEGMFTFERREYNEGVKPGQKSHLTVIAKGHGVYEKKGKDITLMWDKKQKDFANYQAQFPKLTDPGDGSGLRASVYGEMRIYV